MPEWFYIKGKGTIEKLDISNNSKFSQIPGTMGQLENLKSLHINGNQVSTLPGEMIALRKLEEFGLEWWPYITILFDTSVNIKRADQMRDHTTVTNRQILRQISESIRVLNSLPS